MASQSGYTRHHVIVPKADTIVEDWMNEQNNLSGSIRVLIKQFVLKYGVTDILCCADLGAGMFEQQTPKSSSSDSEVEQNILSNTSDDPESESQASLTTNNEDVSEVEQNIQPNTSDEPAAKQS